MRTKARGAFLLGAVLAGCSAPAGAPAPAPKVEESPAARFAKDPEAVERGRLLFVGSCGGYCHSVHDEEKPAPSLFDCNWKHGGTDTAIFQTITKGVPGTQMPAWGGAMPKGDEDVWRIIAFLRTASTCKAGAAKPAH